MKKFDLEAALRGEPVCAEDGRVVEVFSMLKTGAIYAHVNGVLIAIDENGCCFNEMLYMAPQKKTVYVNLYSHGRSTWYETKELAHHSHASNAIAVAIPVEIEV